MALRLSTGLANTILGTSAMQTALAGAALEIYSGTQPLSADDAPTGTLLVTIDNGGLGLNFDAPVGNQISKAVAETWSGVAAATGTAGWFRIRLPADTGAVSTTDVRLDGAVAITGAELNSSNTAVTTGATQTIDAFAVTIPLG
jgi:hypothetical protein